jgi:hypothetical protein
MPLLRSWAEIWGVLRIQRRLWGIINLAMIEAEALVWRHGAEGMAAARALEELHRDADTELRLHAWFVRLIAERRLRLLDGCDPAARYEIVTHRACRPGSMIRRQGS